MPRVDPELVRAVVQDHLKKHGYDGSLTARVVREETERRCGMQPGSLKDQKEALMQAIEARIAHLETKYKAFMPKKL